MQMLMLYKCYDNAMITRMKTKFVQKVKIPEGQDRVHKEKCAGKY